MVIKEWHRFVKTKNTKILDNLLSDEIVFYSPAVHTPIPGIESTKRYLTSAIEILFQGNCKYVREIKGNNIASCEFEGFLNDIYLNGTDIIQWNSSNKIIYFNVFIRTLKGLITLKDIMAEVLVKK